MLRIGIIGAGRIGQVHARSVAENPNTTLAAVSDPMKDAAQSVVDRFGGKVVDTAEELINDPDVDAVIICSPTPFHGDHIVAVTEAGKPVLCEKPLAMDSESVASIKERLEGLNPRVMMGFNRRFDPTLGGAKAIADSGKIGTVEQVSIISRDPAAPPKSYIEVSGGIFKDMTIHDFDMARFILGDIKSVFATGQNLDPELADTGDFDGAVIVMTNADGKVATVTNSRHCATGYDQRVEIFGTDGMACGDNVHVNATRTSTADYADAKTPFLDFFLERYAQAYANELAAFVAAINSEGEFTPSLEDGAAALVLAEAADKSARTGKTVSI